MDTIEQALQVLKQGKMIIVVDDEDRENEGDFLCLGDFATPENINFMATHGKGLICTPVSQKIADRLELNPMINNNTDSHQTAFTVSIDFCTTTTGISAFERSDTILALTDDNTTSDQFKKPGHVFPLIAKDGGVIERRGHTEAGIDLARLCDSTEVAVICEIMNEDGTMARLPDLEKIAKQFNMPLISIEDLEKYMKKQEEGKYQWSM